MDRLAAGQHGHVLLDPLRARFRLLCIVNAIEDRVSIVAVEPLKVLFGSRLAIERGLEIFRDSRFALRRIGRLPPTVALGVLDLPQTGALHPTELDQGKRPLAIDPRPLALLAARREADQPMVGVKLVQLAVDPAVAKRAVDRLLPRDARNAG